MDLNDAKRAGQLPRELMPTAKPVGSGAEDESRIKTVRELLSASHDRAVIVKGSGPKLITTTHGDVDDITGGFQREFVWVIGADTSWGKSSLAVAVADENIKRGNRVLIVPVEDSDKLYADRLMVRRSGVPMDVFRKHRHGRSELSADQRSALARVAHTAEDVPVYIDGRGKPVEWIAKKTAEIIRRENIDLVMFDYLQAFDNQKPQTDRRNQLNYIARLLTDTVKTAGAAGAIFSQLTIKDAAESPDRHSIKDSRDVTNAAEVVALGWEARKPFTLKNGDQVNEGDKILLIDKNKDGVPKMRNKMDWDSARACFKSVRLWDDYNFDTAMDYPT